MPGPAPKDPAVRRRRNASVGKTVLPSGGRVGDVPAWPLAGRTEPGVWVELWRMPQASAWERMHLTRTVAHYAMVLEVVEGSEGLPAAAVLQEMRQMEDRLGLNPKSMRSLLWEVAAGDEVAEKRDEQVPSRTAAKRVELKIVG